MDNLSSFILKKNTVFEQINDVSCKSIPRSLGRYLQISPKSVFQEIRVVTREKSLFEILDYGNFIVFFRFKKVFKTELFAQLHVEEVMAEPDF